ncbi:MAG: Mur ligase family protein [Saprospiraceae bacterium]
MRIHIIAMGGAVMHNLSIALQMAGHQVTGSDDEIYNPAKDKLEKYGLLPPPGWFPNNINPDIELIIVGMHAKKDNPELLKAAGLGLEIMSYPAYIAHHAKDKRRVVVAGSHGKTTTTSMIMHVLKENNIEYDYLVGAPLEGFDLMIKLSDAPVMVIEGDEYLSAPMDPVPKIWHYKPQITVITGIAWDHINVFPTFNDYTNVFKRYIEDLPLDAKMYYFAGDDDLQAIIKNLKRTDLTVQSYSVYPNKIRNGIAYLEYESEEFALEIFGKHNLENIQAATLVCMDIGLNEMQIVKALQSFKGAARRMQPLFISDTERIFLDFAHAPSKVKATMKAVKAQFEGFKIIAILELHTFSSLNKNFIPQYAHALDPADEAVVFFNKHTLDIKRMPDLDSAFIKSAFMKPDLYIFTQNEQLEEYLNQIDRTNTLILFMSSGTFNGVNIKGWALNKTF